MTPRPKNKQPGALKEIAVTARLDAEMHQQMSALRDSEGIPFSFQIRRALELFLEQKGVRPKPKKPQVTTVGRGRFGLY